MPFNGSGIFTRIHNWVNEAGVGTPILPAEFDEQEQDFATSGFSNCITRDGQGGPTADIPWNNFGITGLRAPTLVGDAANKGYVDTATAARSMGGFRYTNLADPVNPQDAATMAYVGGTTTALPVQAGNAGKIMITSGVIASWTDTFSIAMNEVKGAVIPSAATINLTAATGNFVHVSGNTAITGITIPIGAERTVIFDGILTLTHGAALLLPGAANITTAANDRMIVRGDTAGAIVIGYQKADGNPIKGFGTLLATLTPTVAANIDFLTAFTASYDNYLIIGDGITVAADDFIRLRLAAAGTADAGSNYYSVLGASSTAFTTAATSIQLAAAFTSAGKGGSFTLEIKNANDATNLKTVHARAIGQTAATPGYTSFYEDSVYIAANAISGFRLFLNGGSNFGATGKVRVYGYNNT